MRAWLPALMSLLVAAAACDAGGTDGADLSPRDPASTARSAWLDVPGALDTLTVRREALETERGEATFYADLLDRKRTASGEPMDQTAMVAAHRRYPFGTRLRVTEEKTGRAVEVRVIDRGPFAEGRRMPAVIDLSKEAARRLGILRRGRAVVTVEVTEWGDGLPAQG